MYEQTDNTSVDAGFDTLDYNYEYPNSANNDIAIRGERNLWCAVIHQALLDLEDHEEGAEARRWLLRDKQNFILVCSLAGVSPLAVRMAALAKVESLAAVKREENL